MATVLSGSSILPAPLVAALRAKLSLISYAVLCAVTRAPHLRARIEQGDLRPLASVLEVPLPSVRRAVAALKRAGLWPVETPPSTPPSGDPPPTSPRRVIARSDAMAEALASIHEALGETVEIVRVPEDSQGPASFDARDGRPAVRHDLHPADSGDRSFADAHDSPPTTPHDASVSSLMDVLGRMVNTGLTSASSPFSEAPPSASNRDVGPDQQLHSGPASERPMPRSAIAHQEVRSSRGHTPFRDGLASVPEGDQRHQTASYPRPRPPYSPATRLRPGDDPTQIARPDVVTAAAAALRADMQARRWIGLPSSRCEFERVFCDMVWAIVAAAVSTYGPLTERIEVVYRLWHSRRWRKPCAYVPYAYLRAHTVPCLRAA